ncbi:MAG: TauD/TfdA family dioxygenase [Rhizomicrobium sp.]
MTQLASVQDRTIPVSIIPLGDHVTCWLLEPKQPPLFIAPKDGNFGSIRDVVEWARQHLSVLDELILEHGGIVLRGFPIGTTEEFGKFADCFPAYHDSYQGGAAARRQLQGRVYEATQRSGPQRIGIHQEMFYMRDYPRRIAFFARKVAEKGGETIIADMRALSRKIPDTLRSELEKKGIRNVRNFAAPNGKTVETEHMDRRGWDFAFYTDSREEVEDVCKRRGLEPFWHSDGSLTVFNKVDAFETHPVTGENIYRSGLHGGKFYRDAKPDSIAEQVRRSQKFPSGVYLGDGSELVPADEVLLERLVNECTIVWPWQVGDVMILDNLQVGHGRNPFEGERATEVAMFD